MSRLWRVGTRGSTLALVQTKFVLDELQRIRPHDRFETVIIRTAGDRDLQRPISAFGSWGVFVKEIERALLGGTIDLAVHSAKDLTTQLDPGLMVAAFPRRGPVHDVLITRQPWETDADGLPLLPAGARIATSSVRRQGQLREWRPDLHLENLRGSVETRIRKLFDLKLDGIMLAAAGLVRLGLLPAVTDSHEVPVAMTDGYAYYLDPQRFVPAAGQGALAVQVRSDDDETRQLAMEIDDSETRIGQQAERAFMWEMGASCQIPIGALARRDGALLGLSGYYSRSESPRQEIVGSIHQAEALGRELARRMQHPQRPGDEGG